MGWVPAFEPKGRQFDSQSGHMPGLPSKFPVGGCLLYTSPSPRDEQFHLLIALSIYSNNYPSLAFDSFIVFRHLLFSLQRFSLLPLLKYISIPPSAILCSLHCFPASSHIHRLPLTHSQPGAWPATQACALTGNQTSNSLVHRLALNPLSHTSQGWCF